MPNAIVGLKYKPGKGNYNTEEEVLRMLTELKKIYIGFRKSFIVKGANGRELSTPKAFLNYVVKADEPEDAIIILKGSGNIGGIVVSNAMVEYDLSGANEEIQYWDQDIGECCGNCLNHYVNRSQGGNQSECKAGVPTHKMNYEGCKFANPKYKNAQGKMARELEDLVKEVVKSK